MSLSMCACNTAMSCVIHGEFPLHHKDPVTGFIALPTLEEQLEVLMKYLNLKVAVRDWHGVADAAMDIRELEARLLERKK